MKAGRMVVSVVGVGLLLAGFGGAAGRAEIILSSTGSQTGKFSPTNDVKIYEKNPNTNYNSSDLQVGDHAASGEEARTLLAFNLSGVSGTVENATLKMYLYLQGSFDVEPTLDIYRVTDSWGEHSATWNMRDSTWFWSSKGGDFDSTREASTTISGSQPGYREWNVTDLVQDWVDETHPNHGMIVKIRSNEANSWKSFYSSEYSVSNKRPYLLVTVGEDGAIPEPSSWILLAGGVAVLVPLLRREKASRV